MTRVEAEHEPVEKPPASARTLDKEAIHRRCQPHQTEPLAQRRLATDRLAVDTYGSPLSGETIATRSDAQGAASGCDDSGYSPARGGILASGCLSAIDLTQLCPAQAAPRRKKRHGLQQICLAGTVRASKHYRLGTERQPCFAIVAEIG
jgi:hypothetical protein